MESTKKVAVIISVGVAAAAAGAIVVMAVARWRIHEHEEKKLATRLRDVQDVLTDFYDKIKKIESHMPISADHAIPVIDSVGINGHHSH